MHKYRPEAKCPKCACINISSHFYEANCAIWDGGDFDKYEHEVIRRHCRNCGYFWDELPFTEGR